MTVSVAAPLSIRRTLALVVAAALAIAGTLLAVPAEAAGTRVISGTFTIPTTGIEAGWEDTVSASLYTADGNYYQSVTLNTATKTFSATGVDNGSYRLRFEASQLCGYTGCWSANLLSGWYGGGNGTLIDVTTANKTGLTYAFAAGRTISGTVSLGPGTNSGWLQYVYATVSIPGPEGCNCGDAITSMVDASGNYVLRGLAPGAYTVSFQGGTSEPPVPPVNLIPEYYNGSYTWAGSTPVDVRTGNRTGINATLELGRTISGTVTIPGGANPEERNHIYVRATGDNGSVIETQVDPATGAYTLYGLAPTSYTLKASGSNWWNDDYTEIIRTALANVYFGGAYSANDAAHVDVTSTNATGKNITMGFGRSISGTVTLAAGVDAVWKNYLTVHAEDGENYRSGTVDPVTGAYTITGLAPVPQQVEFAATGYGDGEDWIYSPFAFEFYNNKRTPHEADLVNVASSNVSNVNATLDLQVGDRTFWDTPVPVVSGTAAVGSELTVTAGQWAPSANLSYQWKRNGTDIAGATARTYTVTQADAGTTITAAVTGSSSGYTSVTMVSAGTAVPTTPFTTAPTPTISGNVAVTSTVTAVPGTWSPAATFTYQWKRNGVNIAGATAATYSLQPADGGATLTVAVTGSAAGYTPTTKTSAGSTVALAPFASAPPVAITGSAIVGEMLTAVPGTWIPTPTFTYEWLRNGAAIAGATAPTYMLAAEDGGQYITVRLTATATGFQTTTRLSNAVTPAGRPFDAAPAPLISGTFTVGSTLTADISPWTPAAEFGFEWLRDGEPIDGANQGTYTVAAADYQHEIALRITAHRDGYERTVKTSAPGLVGAGAFSAPVPTITGTASVGSTLTAHHGTWSPAASLTYQWKRNGAAISGATAATYKLQTADAGKTITVAVTGSAAGYTTTTKTSAGKAVALTAFTKTPTPTISGSAYVGKTLTASPGTWSPAATLTYQWKLDGTAISGATKSSLKLTAMYVGHSVTVSVTAKKTGYTTTTKTSAAKVVNFSDVPSSTYGYSSIVWFAQQGITAGYADGTFRPSASVRRDHMAQFLYRLSGEPSVTLPSKSPFKDVAKTAAAYESIVWLASEGISRGYGDGTYKPSRSVSRKEMAMFLYRLAGEPSVTLPSKSPFPDVPKTDSGYKAIVWAAQQGITKGYANGTFKPSSPIIRAHMAMFLQRYSLVD